MLTREEVKTACERYVLEKYKNRNFSIISYNFESLGSTPNGFLACHKYLKVFIEIIKNGESVHEEITFFVKMAPRTVEALNNYIEGFGVFKKETKLYKHILPKLHEILNDVSKFTPTSYFLKPDVIVLENLGDYHLGTNRDGTLDYDHLICALRSIANLHASSILLELQVGKNILEMFPDIVEENAYPCDPENIRQTGFRNAVAVMCEFMKLIPKYKDRLEEILQELPLVLARIFDFAKTSQQFRNVLLHGDLWANNVMYRYASILDSNGIEREQPIESCLIDFQLARYAPPMLDVITILTIPTTRKFRQKHLNNLLENYYYFLEHRLARYNINVENIMSKSEFWESVNHFKLAGLIESCLFSHLTLLPDDISSKMVCDSNKFEDFLMKKRTKVCLEAFQNDIYSERMTDMLSNIVDEYII